MAGGVIEGVLGSSDRALGGMSEKKGWEPLVYRTHMNLDSLDKALSHPYI